MSNNRNPEQPHPFAHELRYERDDMQDEMRAEIEMAAQTPEQRFRTLVDWVLLEGTDIHAKADFELGHLVRRLQREAYLIRCLLSKRSAK